MLTSLPITFTPERYETILWSILNCFSNIYSSLYSQSW